MVWILGRAMAMQSVQSVEGLMPTPTVWNDRIRGEVVLVLQKRKSLERTREVKSKINGQRHVVNCVGDCLHLAGFRRGRHGRGDTPEVLWESNVRTIRVPIMSWKSS